LFAATEDLSFTGRPLQNRRLDETRIPAVVQDALHHLLEFRAVRRRVVVVAGRVETGMPEREIRRHDVGEAERTLVERV